MRTVIVKPCISKMWSCSLAYWRYWNRPRNHSKKICNELYGILMCPVYLCIYLWIYPFVTKKCFSTMRWWLFVILWYHDHQVGVQKIFIVLGDLTAFICINSILSMFAYKTKSNIPPNGDGNFQIICLIISSIMLLGVESNNKHLDTSFASMTPK